MEISIFAAFWCLKVAEIWDVIVLNNKVNIFTEMINQVSISIQNLHQENHPTLLGHANPTYHNSAFIGSIGLAGGAIGLFRLR